LGYEEGWKGEDNKKPIFHKTILKEQRLK
jgi:hypothetical protein